MISLFLFFVLHNAGLSQALPVALGGRARETPPPPLAPTDALAFWAFQEPTGAPRVSSGVHAYVLHDANASAPIPCAPGGVFGAHAAQFVARGANNTARLFARRGDVPALTTALSGANATVTLLAWVNPAGGLREGMVAGVWDEHNAARQYALFTDLGACSDARVWKGGLAAHVSNCGGATPNHTYCVTRACDPRALPTGAWHCLANVYNGTHIVAYVNGSLVENGRDNPFFYPGGIYAPEAAGKEGAEFGVGANAITPGGGTGGWPTWANAWEGLVGGLAVFGQGLSVAQVREVCGAARGFGGEKRQKLL